MAPTTADHPHPWTLILGIAALGVSTCSLWQSCKATKLSNEAIEVSRGAYRLNQAVSHAAVQIASARLATNPATARFLSVDLVLTNFGQTKAVNIDASSAYEVTQVAFPVENRLYDHPRFADMERGFTQTVRIQSNIGLAMSHERLVPSGAKLLIHGVLRYRDQESGTASVDRWCFIYDPHDPDQVQSLELRRCQYQTFGDPTPQ